MTEKDLRLQYQCDTGSPIKTGFDYTIHKQEFNGSDLIAYINWLEEKLLIKLDETGDSVRTINQKEYELRKRRRNQSH